jgi:hypothetical protein
MRRGVVRGAAAVVVLGLIAAAGLVWGSGAGRTGCAEPRPTVLSLSATPRANNALIADVQLTLDRPAGIHFEYGAGPGDWLRAPGLPAAATATQALLRLRPQTHYEVRAYSDSADGCAALLGTSGFETGALPNALRKMVVTTTGQPSTPMMLMDARPPGSVARWLLALDGNGQIVWYYELPPEIPPGPPAGNAIVGKPRASGSFVYLAGYFGLDEISPDGRLLQRFAVHDGPAARPHHDFVELPDGQLLFLAAEDRVIDDTPNGGPAQLKVRGDTLHRLDLASGREEVVWRAFDSLDPVHRNRDFDAEKIEGVVDWTHGNSVSIGPRGNVLVSLRNLNQVLSLAPDFSNIEWKLGGPDSSFRFPEPSDSFFAQHAATQPTDDTVLVFDNGKFREGKDYSRGLQLQLDRTIMTARSSWAFAPQPSRYADILGNAIRLPNGQTLLSFGFGEHPTEPVLTFEVAADGSPVWQLTVAWPGSRTSSYRSAPLPTLGGELSIGDPS